MSSFCDGNECIEGARRSVLEELPLDARSVEDVYSNNLDPKVKDYLGSFESTIRLVNTKDVDEVIDKLTLIQDKLRSDKSLKEEDKYLGLAAGSIAIESTKLWTSVFDDLDHPLRAIKNAQSSPDKMFQHRDLQIDIPDNDIVVNVELETRPNIDLVILVDVLAIIAFFGVPFPAILASLYAFFFVQIEIVPAPTADPTLAPVKAPSKSPSASPTHAPSVLATAIPSTSPTTVPTSAPSSSDVPSSVPSTVLSSQPSQLPSLTPSISKVPSSAPSSSNVPSSVPSSAPSSQPSQLPSLTPSISKNPSSAPSSSSIPSFVPSSAPSSAPSSSSIPSSAPSSAPSAAPSPA